MFAALFGRKVPSITVSELAQRLPQKPQLLDVRTPAEYQQGHIRGAKNVPLAKLQSFKSREQEVYLICQSGMRSRQGAKLLQKQGYQVINVQGGMNQWSGQLQRGK